LRISGKRENIGGKTPSNLFEAVVAAIYLDGGIENASIFMDKFLVECELENDVRILQEYVQKQKRLPTYSDPVQGENGKFYCTVEALGEQADGYGESKQAAKMNAAKALLEIIRKGKTH
jgi:ribonuclease-3